MLQLGTHQPSVNAIIDFARGLPLAELDSLKYRLSIAVSRELENGFEVGADVAQTALLSAYLESIWRIQPYWSRVPEFGIAYVGRPDFITDDLLAGLIAESDRHRSLARLNYDQMITRIETVDDATLCEQLAASDALHDLVGRYAGFCAPSYVTSYIYYDQAGHCSRPHVDNMFTGVTAMLNLRNQPGRDPRRRSATINYWLDRKPRVTIIEPGEMIIFFGASALHGRSPVQENERINSLLMSFRPI